MVEKRGDEHMLSKYAKFIPALKEVKILASQRSAEYNRKHPYGESFSFDNPDDIKRAYEEAKLGNPLQDYLMHTDFETVKVVQIVMYIGRDYPTQIREYREESYDAYHVYENITPVENGDGLIDQWMRDIHGVNGWNTQAIEVNQIVQKLPLDEYLNRAFKILGI